jgi:hypothetical protein
MRPIKIFEQNFVKCEKMDSLIAGILNYSSIENHTHEERVIDVNLVVQDFLKTIEVPDNANIHN